MPTPLEKLTTDWQAHYSDMPLSEFVTKVHGKLYSDIPFSDFTDKLGLTVPPSPIREEPPQMSDIAGASPWPVGDVPTPGEVIRPALRYGLPVAAGMAAGAIPVGGVVAGPLAAATTDLALSKIYGEGEGAERETSFLTDVGAGLLPSAAKGAASIIRKAIPAPLETKIANTIRWGFEKGIRPTVAGKANAQQTEQYYKKAQSAVESIIENKPTLKFTDEAGLAVTGKLPQNLHQFSQAIDQTKRGIFSQYDQMVRASGDLGRTVDLDGVVSELKAFQANRVNKMVGGSGGNRADALIEGMSGQKLSLSETQDMIALLNGRLKAFYANPSPDLASSAAIDALAANKLRASLDSAVEKYGYQELKNRYGALRSIEKEVSNRALVDARKNTKGLIDFADIASAAEAARAVASMSAGPAAAAGAIKAMKEWYKHINNPNRIVKKMFSDAEMYIASRGGALPLKALTSGPRVMGSGHPDPSGITVTTGPPLYQKALPSPARPMGSGLLDGSYVRGVPAGIQPKEGLLSLPPKGSTIRTIELLGDYEKLFSVRPQVR